MEVKVLLDDGAFLPEKAYDADAGFDIRTPIDFKIYGEATIDTGVHMKIPKGFVGMLKSKSGLNINYNLVGEGVVDADYVGSIKVKLYNMGGIPHEFKRGDKLIQIVILPIPCVYLVQVDELPITHRGTNGFGSTGR